LSADRRRNLSPAKPEGRNLLESRLQDETLATWSRSDQVACCSLCNLVSNQVAAVERLRVTA